MKQMAFCLVFLGSLAAYAQKFSSEHWHDGFLVTSEQDTVTGLVKYDLEQNVVQVIQNNVVKTYSSHKVFYFEIFDKLVETYRQFYAIPFNVNYNYKVPIIFELLYEGPISLLAREAIVQETVTNTSAYWGGSYVRDKVAHTFYFLDKKGNIRHFSGKRNDLFYILPKNSGQLKDFIKKNKLRTDDVRDLIRITAFYNSL